MPSRDSTKDEDEEEAYDENEYAEGTVEDENADE